jgi:hypothetical protein
VFWSFFPSNQVDFAAGTLFMLDVSASVTGAMGQGKIKADRDDEIYTIPALGYRHLRKSGKSRIRTIRKRHRYGLNLAVLKRA